MNGIMLCLPDASGSAASYDLKAMLSRVETVNIDVEIYGVPNAPRSWKAYARRFLRRNIILVSDLSGLYGRKKRHRR